MQVKIHRVTSRDTALFRRIAEDVFDEAVTPSRLAAYLAEPGHLMVVAIVAEEIVGQVAAVIHRHPDKPTELYIDEVGVAPDHHRRGVATKMIDEMLCWGRELGCEEAWVGTEPDNGPARALYRRHADGIVFILYEWDL